MKNWLNKQRIILIILILIIISGIITLGVAGFEKSIEYTAGTRIEIYIPMGYEKEEIVEIAKESFNGKEISFVEIEKLNQVAGIKLDNYTEEELKGFKSKILEKYDIDEKNLELYEVNVPETKISTVVEPYVLPIIIVTVLALIYVGIKCLKSRNSLKMSLKLLLTLIIVLATYFSIIALTRLEFGIFTMPVALALYIITLLIAVKNIKK